MAYLEWIPNTAFGRLVINNPPANALTKPDFIAAQELEAFLNNEQLKGLIVQGSGKHFCAGADLKTLRKDAKNPQALQKSLADGRQLLQQLDKATVPVLALVRGSCLGAGLELALACHFRFASPNSLIGFPEADYGIFPGMGGLAFATSQLPRSQVMELVLNTACINGSEAFERGIVDRVVDSKDLEQAGLEYLHELTDRHSTKLIRAALASIHDGRFLSREIAFERESQRFFDLIQDAHLED